MKENPYICRKATRRIMKRTILLLILTMLSAAAAANERIRIHNTRIPVITDRSHNILA